MQRRVTAEIKAVTTDGRVVFGRGSAPTHQEARLEAEKHLRDTMSAFRFKNPNVALHRTGSVQVTEERNPEVFHTILFGLRDSDIMLHKAREVEHVWNQ